MVAFTTGNSSVKFYTTQSPIATAFCKKDKYIYCVYSRMRTTLAPIVYLSNSEIISTVKILIIAYLSEGEQVLSINKRRRKHPIKRQQWKQRQLHGAANTPKYP